MAPEAEAAVSSHKADLITVTGKLVEPAEAAEQEMEQAALALSFTKRWDNVCDMKSIMMAP